MLILLKKLLRLLSLEDRKKLFKVFLLVMVMAMIESLGVISIMPFLAVLANSMIIDSNPFIKKLYLFLSPKSYQNFIIYLGLMSLLFISFSAIFKIFTQYNLNKFSNLQRHTFSLNLLKVYLDQDYSFFIQKNSSDLVKNILSETDQLVWNMIQPALLMMSYLVVMIAMVLILITYNLVMAISVALILLLFYILIFYIIKQKLYGVGEAFAHANKERYQSCQEALTGIKDVIVNSAQQGYINSFEENSLNYARYLSFKDTLGQVPRYVIETVGYGCLIILAIILVISGDDVSYILPILGLYGFTAYRMLPAAQNIYQSITQIKFSEPIFNLINNEFLLKKQGFKEIDGISPNLSFEKQIFLKNINFAYPDRPEKLILNNFNLVIKKNSSLGIIGKSGSGKSTLMDVILGLLKPTSGTIYIDNYELSKSYIKAWQKNIGYVPQNIYLTDKSIAENIAFGIENNKINMILVRFAAQQAQIDDFIMQELKDGYSTVIGERGIMLSGGQRQRIGIARALYKDPQVIFMDEATSALDSETELAINEAIKNLNGHKTIIIIAHRESSVSMCDNIINLS